MCELSSVVIEVVIAGLQMPPALQSAVPPKTTYNCKLLSTCSRRQGFTSPCPGVQPAYPLMLFCLMVLRPCPPHLVVCAMVRTPAGPMQPGMVACWPAPCSLAAFMFWTSSSSHFVMPSYRHLACCTQTSTTAQGDWARPYVLLCCASPNHLGMVRGRVGTAWDRLLLPCLACCADH